LKNARVFAKFFSSRMIFLFSIHFFLYMKDKKHFNFNVYFYSIANVFSIHIFACKRNDKL